MDFDIENEFRVQKIEVLISKRTENFFFWGVFCSIICSFGNFTENCRKEEKFEFESVLHVLQ